MSSEKLLSELKARDKKDIVCSCFLFQYCQIVTFPVNKELLYLLPFPY